MTDLEMTKLCAEAMGVEFRQETALFETLVGQGRGHIEWRKREYSNYDPLHDDAQAMALAKKFKLDIVHAWKDDVVLYRVRGTIAGWEVTDHLGDLNRAIVECVAKMQAEKVTA